MTTLQNRIGAYARYAAASGVMNAVNTEVEAVERPETLDIPDAMTTKTYEEASVLAEALERFLAAEIWAAPRQFHWALTTTLDAEIFSEEFSSPESPFDALDDLRSDEDKVCALVSLVRQSLDRAFAAELAKRLEFLIEVASEEAPNQAKLSPDSLRMFVRFLQTAPQLNCPEVMLTPSGNVRAQWRSAANRHFAVEFYPDGEVAFVIFRPDAANPQRTARFSGLVSVGSLMSEAAPHGVLDWAAQ